MADPASRQQPDRQLAPVPLGWTELIHGTDSVRWTAQGPAVTITNRSLSAITAEEAARTKQSAENLRAQGIATTGYDTTRSYAGTTAPGVEVRVLFLREDLAVNRRPGTDIDTFTDTLGRNERLLASKYHQPRHPEIPSGEVLLKLGEGPSESGRTVQYYVPASVADLYVQSLKREGVPLDSLPKSVTDTARALQGRRMIPVKGAETPGATKADIAAAEVLAAVKPSVTDDRVLRSAIVRAERHERGAAAGFVALNTDPERSASLSEAINAHIAQEPAIVRSLGELSRQQLLPPEVGVQHSSRSLGNANDLTLG